MLSRAVYVFFQLLTVLVLARVLASWFRPRYRTSGNSWFFTIDDLIWRATEPFMAPIRNILPTGGMMFDFSPLLVLLIISLVGGWIVSFLRNMGL